MNKHVAGFIRAALASLALIVVLAGCASGYHYSQVSGDRYYKTNLDTYPLTILQVDGRSYVGRAPILVDPGRREILVQGPPAFVNLRATQVFTLDVKDCTRYYLVAVKSNRMDNDFDVKIDFEEPVAGCTPPPN